MLTSAKNEAVKFRDEREIYRCTRKRQGCTRKRHASGRGSLPSQPSQLLRLQSLRSADIHNPPHRTSAEERAYNVLRPESERLRVHVTDGNSGPGV